MWFGMHMLGRDWSFGAETAEPYARMARKWEETRPHFE